MATISERVAARFKGGSIKEITKAYIRTYKDSGQVTGYVEWVDHKGKKGRTEGDPKSVHMKALFDRAKREGVKVEKETW